MIFLILSAATEVTALACACMPIVGPKVVKQYKRHRHTHTSYYQGYQGSKGSKGSKLRRLSFSGSHSRQKEDQIALNSVQATSHGKSLGNEQKDPSGGLIWVENEIEVTVGDNKHEADYHNSEAHI